MAGELYRFNPHSVKRERERERKAEVTVLLEVCGLSVRVSTWTH